MCYIDAVKELISLTNVHNLTEIEIHQDLTRIRIKKGQGLEQHDAGRRINNQGFVGEGHGQHFFSVPQFGGPYQPSHPVATEEEPLTECGEITSPMVGTFYRALSPETKPFIDIGVEVNPETVVGVVETMKIINEVKAGVSGGKVVEILVGDGEAVEFGQPLFRVQGV